MFTFDIYVYVRMRHVCEGVPRGQKRAGITGGDEVSCVGAGKSSCPLLDLQDRAFSTALPTNCVWLSLLQKIFPKYRPSPENT